MRKRKRSRWWLVVTAWLGCWLAARSGAAEPQGSLRLVVQPEREWVLAGHAIGVTIGLRDARNQPAAAPIAFTVALALTPPVASAAATVTIPVGQSQATLQLRPAKPGILEIRATHPQAFQGDGFVRVTTRAPSTRRTGPVELRAPGAAKPGAAPARTVLRSPASTPVASTAPSHLDALPSPRTVAPIAPTPGHATSPPRVATASGSGSRSTPASTGAPGSNASGDSATSPPHVASGSGSRSAPAAFTVAPGPAPVPPQKAPDHAARIEGPPGFASEDNAASPSPSPASASAASSATATPHLELRYSPQRKLLADGRDAVTIHAFLFNGDADPQGTADSAFKVTLFASSGSLEPTQLVIQDGEGHATLTADKPGDIVVEVVRSQPRLDVDGESRMRIHFGVPIHGVRLEAKPASISLVVDATGRPVATDEPLVVRLALDSGRGEIAHTELSFQSGAFEARSRFIATGVGEVAVSAASPSLLDQTTRLDVRLPLGLLALSVIGGLVGGLLAYYRRRHSRRTRIAVGAVTGFLLYWAFMFGLVRVLPRGFVLNPLSNFALSAIGGWLGTEVFTLLLRWLGLRKPTAHQERTESKHDAHAEHDGGQAAHASEHAMTGDRMGARHGAQAASRSFP
jgi:hypothetical protein